MGTFQHANVGSTLTQAEFNGVDLHTVSGQAAGDMMYADSADSWERVAVGGNGEYLQMIGGVPTWGAVSVSVDANNLTGNTLNSGVVTSSLEAVGTIGTGLWQGTHVGEIYGGTGQTTWTTGDIPYSSASNTISKLGIGTQDQQLRVSATGVPEWFTASGSGVSVGLAMAFAIVF